MIQAVPALKSTPHELNWVFEGLADRVRDAGIEGLIETIDDFGKQMGRSEPDEAFHAELRSHREPASIELALRNVPNWCIPDIPSALGTFPFPVIVQGWDDDPIHPLVFARECAAAAGVELLELDQNAVMDDRTAAGRAYVERLSKVSA